MDGPGHRFHIVDEDRLRELILDFSPQIQRDVDIMADLIRDQVKLEREKSGFDNPRGTLELYPNQKKHAADPDLIGTGRIAGRVYRAAAWCFKTDRLKIALLPARKAK